MKHRNVEKRQFNNEGLEANKNVRELISQRLPEFNPLHSKRLKKLISTLAVGLALFGSNGKPSQEEISRALAQTKVEEVTDEIVQKGMDLVEWVGDFIKSQTPTLNAPSSETSKKSPVNSTTDSLLNDNNFALGRNIEISETSVNTGDTAPQNEMVFRTLATPSPIGKEPEGYYRTELKEALRVSLDSPFNTEQANNIFKESGLTVYDLLVSEITQKENLSLTDFSDPNVPSMAMFPDETMRWTPLVEELNRTYNSKERFGFMNNGNTEFLGLIYIESYGRDEATPNYAGAISPAQVTFYPIDALAPGSTYAEKFAYASVPENGVKLGYQWFLMNKSDNLRRFDFEKVSDPVTKSAINFMTYNGGATYSFVIAEGGVDSIRHLTDTIQMRKYALMNNNLMYTYQLFLSAYQKGYKVTYEDSLKEGNDVRMFQSDLLNQILEEAYAKKRLSNGSFEDMTKILKETIASYEGREVSLVDIKKNNTEETEGSLYDTDLPPAVRAVTLFYNR